MNPSEREQWVVVAEFHMIADGALSADLAVSKLEGSGIPAMRFPSSLSENSSNAPKYVMI